MGKTFSLTAFTAYSVALLAISALVVFSLPETRGKELRDTAWSASPCPSCCACRR
jgi:hypothetical protein